KYAGKGIDQRPKLKEIQAELPTVEKVVVIPFLEDRPDVAGIPNAVLLDDFLRPFEAGEIEFERVPFDHPRYIPFSSGNTAVPKCVVHPVGGALLMNLGGHGLDPDAEPGDRLF